MYTKNYRYDDGQKACIKLIEYGFVHTFEEIFNLRDLNEVVIKEAECGLVKNMPKEFCSNLKILQCVQDSLKNSEQALRKGALKDNNEIRMNLGKYFHEVEGYTWLADYFYKSVQDSVKISADTNVNIVSLEQQALLEVNKGNTDTALNYLEGALEITMNSETVDNSTQKRLEEQLSRIYYQLGTEYLDRDDLITDTKSLKYIKKAVKLAMAGDNVENQAICNALLGKAFMKHKMEKKALKRFQKYIDLSNELNDMHGLCQGYFAKSEVYKRKGNLEESMVNLKISQKLAKENNHDSSFIFASISLGQIATAKRQYVQANEHFEEAHQTLLSSKENFPDKKTLMKLTKIMCGIGRAHLSFSHLILTLQSPSNLSLPKLFSWKNRSGPFTGEVTDNKDYLIDMEETEKNQDTEVSEVIEKLLKQELQ